MRAFAFGVFSAAIREVSSPRSMPAAASPADPTNLDAATRVEHISFGAELGWVADVLARQRDAVLAGWLEAAEAQPFHAGRRERAVADHIPSLFDALVAVLRRTAPRWAAAQAPLDDPEVLRAARDHARARFEQGLQAADVVTEFRLLRQEIGRALRRNVAQDAQPSDVVGAEVLVHDALDGAIGLGVAALADHVEEVREDFLATTLHDTQQPITVIKGLAQMALRGMDRAEYDPARLRETLRKINVEADRLAELLATLSEVSRLTLGRLSLEVVPTELPEVVREAVGRMPPESAARVRLALPPAGEARGDWDPRMLGRVVGNLLSNAAKYSPEDAPIEVTVAYDAPTDTVELQVRDYGIGLAADEIAGLFRRYGRTRGAVDRGIQGLGLGLYLSHGIVEAHGGTIWTTSAGPGTGTTMYVRLPRSVPALAGVQGPPITARPPTGSAA